MDFLQELNDEQKAAVTTINGPVMIIAGPGSGKTRVLTFRIAHLINTGVDAFRILALTFTNKASTEMRERIHKMSGGEARNLYMGTFHSVFARILRMEAEKLGFPSSFTIYDTDDAKNLLKSIIKEEGLNDKIYKPANIFYRISSAKNSLIGPSEYKNNIDLIADDRAAMRPHTAYLYEQYQKRLFMAGAMDFDDLLFKFYELLSNFPEILYKWQNRFTHIMIDEFQDTNYAQYEIIKKLGAVHENICVVGDDAQSIYAFRGATIQNIMNFEKDYPDLQVFKLEQNYRSSPFIVNAANEIISNNKFQLKKTIWTERSDGFKIKVVKNNAENDEAKMVADSIFELKMRQHLQNNDFAILYRTNAQSRSFEEALRRMNIPYKIYGGISFYQRKEVKDFLCYLRIVVNPADEEALKRIINYPTRGIGQTTMDRMIVAANEHNISLWQVLENPEYINDIQGRTRHALSNFAMMIKSFATLLAKKSAYELAEIIGKQTGLVEELYKDKTAEGVSRYENIQELLNGIKLYTESEQQQEVSEDEVLPDNDLAAYLQQISLLTDMDNDKNNLDTVKLMTVHASKGLEFPAVFVVGLEEGLFPSGMADTREGLEEERRLFYVAITRAMHYLTLTYATMRYRFGNIEFNPESRFLEEIDPKNIYFMGIKTVVPKSSHGLTQEDLATAKTPPRLSNPQRLAGMKSAQVQKARISEDLKSIKSGDRVSHDKYATGVVISTEGSGDNIIAGINFEKFGLKKIMLKFSKLTLLHD
jgi:DNA helicase-2/ATP-dependent DNA helicase PcrA